MEANHDRLSHNSKHVDRLAKTIGGTGGTYEVEFTYGDAIDLPDHTDGGSVEAGYVSVSYLSRITDVDRDDAPCAEGALNSLLDQ